MVGCATGYAAAIIAKLAGQVTATESDSSLAAKAGTFWPGLGWPMLRCGRPRPPRAIRPTRPMMSIVLNGATEIVPDRLYGQLKEGGRLVGVFAITQPPRATIVTRSHGDFGDRALFDATVPVLPGLERVAAFVF